jgi:non-canonical purine NTP pyrophosphatase (RdgB/HAM1 family)
MLTFITSNTDKRKEVERLFGRPLAHAALSLEEIQAVEVKPIVSHKAQQAYAELGCPVLVEDTGLAFAAWNGLPGALIKWFLDSLGTEKICDLLRNEPHRVATATTLFAYCDKAGVQIFGGAVSGTVPLVPRGIGGFGWDTIFQPVGSEHTFAEMSPQEKDRFSMRRLAIERLRDSRLVA